MQQTAHFFLSCKYSTRDTIPAIEPKAPRTDKKVPRERMFGTGIKITEFPLDNPVLLCYCMNTLIQQYRRHEM